MKDRLDIIHSNIIQRCTNPRNPAYERYGARGITVCDEWRKIRAFRQWAYDNGYAPHLTIDRINNDDGYSPGNCRWVTIKENCNNRSSTHFVTAFGETHSLREWSEILGISYNTLKKKKKKECSTIAKRENTYYDLLEGRWLMYEDNS